MRLKHKTDLPVPHRGQLLVIQLVQVLARQCTSPVVGRSSVPMMFSSVLFPEPDGPMIASDSPRATSSETP